MTAKSLSASLSGLAIGLALAAGLGLGGCSQRDTPPATPSVNVTTPTYRSATNSWELNNSPEYTQPGVNHGKIESLPAIARHERFDQNAPLAISAYSAMQSKLASDSRYLMAQAQGGVLMIGGTVSTQADKVTAAKTAAAVPGVTKLIDTITVSAVK